MGIKELWNHHAFFDYKDRYMQVEKKNRETSKFVEKMWDTYRADYSPVWTMSPILKTTAIDGSVIKIPEKEVFNLGQTVTLKAIADNGYMFESWSGDFSGTENPVKIIMHADLSIIANFIPTAAATQNLD